jgi:TRAP transporter TAXI family solute receptor
MPGRWRKQKSFAPGCSAALASRLERSKGRRPKLRAAVAALLLAFAGPVTAQELRLFTLGSGEVGGAYFSAATVICDNFNRARRGEFRCSPEATAGSIYNLAALRDRQLDFALVQSDWHRAAYTGTDALASHGPMPELRSVMALFPEAITVLARPDSGIVSLSDLPGKRIDIGHPASGRRATVMRMIDSLGFVPADFAALFELPAGAAVDELCAGRIDTTVLFVGHPNSTVARATERCGAFLVPVAGPAIDDAFGNSTDYVPGIVPANAYPTLRADVPTFAVTATLVTRDDIPEDIVAALVSETVAALPELALRAPVLTKLSPEAMQSRGLTAPLHAGAEKAFGAAAAGG